MKMKLERLGHLFFYIVLKFCGLRCAYLFLYPVIFSYVLFSKKIHRTTSAYLQRRFPEHDGVELFFDTFHNLYSFGQVLIDRAWLGLKKQAKVSGTINGRDKLIDTIGAGKGAVLVTAHVGNWQTAMASLDFLPVKVHALMQYDQRAAAKHFFDLGNRKRPFGIIDIEGPFGGLVDATAALQRGEVVTIMADRHIKGTTQTVDFLGKEVRLPDAAYTLAACVGTPVIIFLAAKTGEKKFELRVWDILQPQFTDRETRQEMLHDCCKRFAQSLEEYLKKYPYQWYNFFDIWNQADEQSSMAVSTSTNSTETNG